jgi:biotin carboxyl carrier protein
MLPQKQLVYVRNASKLAKAGKKYKIRGGFISMKKYTITVNGTAYDVEVEDNGAVASAPKAAAPVAAAPKAAAPKAAAPKAAPKAAAKPVAAGATTVSAPMPGKISKILKHAGDTVKSGDVLIMLEAMKMQNEIMAPCDGKVADVRVNEGAAVNTGDVLVVLG